MNGLTMVLLVVAVALGALVQYAARRHREEEATVHDETWDWPLDPALAPVRRVRWVYDGLPYRHEGGVPWLDHSTL